ncbi:MAG: PH domain-containing protein [Rhodoferax sp.]|nr:PH domain-containing protein [Rhodoferax sp.]
MKAVVQEHEYEAAHGLPEQLPAGEKILWQGAPHWQTLARDAMHLRLLAVYFAVLLAWRAGAAWMDTGSLGTAALSIVLLLPLALLALATLAVLAWLASRNSVYTITNRRVVMRVGIVLTVTFNLPYRRIESASLRRNANGTGDIALLLSAGDQIAYLHLWPHVRAWHVRRSQPMLRAIPDCARVSEMLVQAIADSAAAGQSVVRAAPTRVSQPVTSGSSGPVAA